MMSHQIVESYNVIHTLREELDKMSRKNYLNERGEVVLEAYNYVLFAMPFHDTVTSLLLDEEIVEILEECKRYQDGASLKFYLESQREKENAKPR